MFSIFIKIIVHLLTFDTYVQWIKKHFQIRNVTLDKNRKEDKIYILKNHDMQNRDAQNFIERNLKNL